MVIVSPAGNRRKPRYSGGPQNASGAVDGRVIRRYSPRIAVKGERGGRNRSGHLRYLRSMAIHPLIRTTRPEVLGTVLLACALSASGCGNGSSSTSARSCPAGQVIVDGQCTDVAAVAEQVRAIVAETQLQHGLRSVILSLSIDDVPVLTQAWGESLTGVPATTAMHFRSGAVAITYLTTVLLQQHERGVVRLDDVLANWFPQYPEADRITLAMLANNTSGYPEYVNLEILPLHEDPFRQWTPDELIALALTQRRRCDPGACFSYAHTNYVILGEVLSLATGRDVADLIRDGILKPLRLRETLSDSTAFIPEPVLHAFTSERGTYEESTYWNPSWTIGRGAVMTSTIEDVRRSAIAIGEGTLLTPASHELQLAFTDVPPLSEQLYFGLGVIVANGWVLQTPSFSGYSAVMAYLPAHRIAIAVTSTAGPDTPDDMITNRL